MSKRESWQKAHILIISRVFRPESLRLTEIAMDGWVGKAICERS